MKVVNTKSIRVVIPLSNTNPFTQQELLYPYLSIHFLAFIRYRCKNDLAKGSMATDL